MGGKRLDSLFDASIQLVSRCSSFRDWFIINFAVSHSPSPADDPYYCGMRAKVSGKELQALGKSHAGNSATLIMQQHNAGGASRKMTTLPAPKHQKMRKCQSTSYLNSYMKTPLYADRNSFYPGQHNPYSIGQ